MYMGSINKLSKMNAAIIDGKIIIIEIIKLKIWASEHVPLKRYWRIKIEIMYAGNTKIVQIF